MIFRIRTELCWAAGVVMMVMIVMTIIVIVVTMMVMLCKCDVGKLLDDPVMILRTDRGVRKLRKVAPRNQVKAASRNRQTQSLPTYVLGLGGVWCKRYNLWRCEPVEVSLSIIERWK